MLLVLCSSAIFSQSSINLAINTPLIMSFCTTLCPFIALSVKISSLAGNPPVGLPFYPRTIDESGGLLAHRLLPEGASSPHGG